MAVRGLELDPGGLALSFGLSGSLRDISTPPFWIAAPPDNRVAP